jgi:hypothetical protein
MAIEAKAVRMEIQDLGKRISNHQCKLWQLTKSKRVKARNSDVFNAMVRSHDDKLGKRAWMRYVRLMTRRDVVPIKQEIRRMKVQRSALWVYYRSLKAK